MSTISVKLEPKLRTWTKAARGMALLGALLLASLAVNALIILADGKVRQRTPAVAECALIPDQVGRLACYDRTQAEATPHPFRGANAPVRGSL
jgi:hypothetical protein